MKNKITSVKVRIRDEIASNVTLRITYFIYYSLQRKSPLRDLPRKRLAF